MALSVQVSMELFQPSQQLLARATDTRVGASRRNRRRARTLLQNVTASDSSQSEAKSSTNHRQAPSRREVLLGASHTLLCAAGAALLPQDVQARESSLHAASLWEPATFPTQGEQLLPTTSAFPSADTSITDVAFLDVSLCPTATRLDRTLGDMSAICNDGEPLGRILIGLYGRAAPTTVQHFLAMVSGLAGSSYRGTTFHKSLPGQYVAAGRQGAVEKGEVAPPTGLGPNSDAVSAQAFRLSHLRPGTVSLCLGENDDDDERKQLPGYRNVEFMITTGPGPATQLDGANIVFGTVLEGMDVVSRMAAVPTFVPSDRIRQFNSFAELLGDERAAKGRSTWNRPLKAIVIQDCGVVPAESRPLGVEQVGSAERLAV